jgi:hypothetical protein
MFEDEITIPYFSSSEDASFKLEVALLSLDDDSFEKIANVLAAMEA